MEGLDFLVSQSNKKDNENRTAIRCCKFFGDIITHVQVFNQNASDLCRYVINRLVHALSCASIELYTYLGVQRAVIL